MHRPSAPASPRGSASADHPISPSRRNRDIRPANAIADNTKVAATADGTFPSFIPIIATESVLVDASAYDEDFRDMSHHLDDQSSTVLFTYDLSTGRKVFVNSLEVSRSTASKRSPHKFASNKKMTVPWIRPPPTMPEWPGDRLAETSQNWVQRTREIRSIDAAIAAGVRLNKYDAMPRFYTAYNRLEPLDLVISVEHCFNCKHHCMTLRHDPKEYIKYADAALLVLARKLHGRLIKLLRDIDR